MMLLNFNGEFSYSMRAALGTNKLGGGSWVSLIFSSFSLKLREKNKRMSGAMKVAGVGVSCSRSSLVKIQVKMVSVIAVLTPHFSLGLFLAPKSVIRDTVFIQFNRKYTKFRLSMSLCSP